MFGKKMGNTRVKLLAGIVMFYGSAAMTSGAVATDLNSGGAITSTGGFFGWKPSSDPFHDRFRKNSDVLANSLFGAGMGANTVQYCQTGSGAGKRVLNGDTSGTPPYTPTGVCGNFGDTVTTNGFSTPAIALVQPDFAISGAPFANSEYLVFLSNRPARVAPVQFPALVGSIAIAYHNSDADAQNIRLNLSESTVCGIFSGAITDWNQVDSRLQSHPINVVFRRDGSGTSFNFTNHLAANCGLAAPNQFLANQVFPAAVATLPLSGRILGNINVLPVDSDPATINAINGTPFSIGYVGAAYTLAYSPSTWLPTGASVVTVALIDNKDPIADLPANYSVAATSVFPTPVVLDKVVSNAQWHADGTAILISPTSSVPSAASGCMVVVDPNYYAKPSNTAQNGGYPIIAISYLMAGHSGNSTNLPALRKLLSLPYSATHTGVGTIGSGTGFSFLTNSTVTTIKVTLCTEA